MVAQYIAMRNISSYMALLSPDRIGVQGPQNLSHGCRLERQGGAGGRFRELPADARYGRQHRRAIGQRDSGRRAVSSGQWDGIISGYIRNREPL